MESQVRPKWDPHWWAKGGTGAEVQNECDGPESKLRCQNKQTIERR